MARYALRRLLHAIPILFGVTLVVFFVIRMAPGDPFSGMVDPRIDPAQIAAARERLGLNAPLYIQYLRWLGELLKGNLGWSIRHQLPVSAIIAQRMPASLLLGVATMVVVWLVAIPVGVVAATRKGSWLDHLVTGLTFAGLAMPSFFVGLLLVRTFALQLGWFPSSGMVSAGSSLSGLASYRDVASHLVLPVLTLGTISLAGLMRYVRSGMIEVLRQDFIRVARAKGLRERTVTFRHALKNAMLPVITLMGLELPTLVGGAILTESIFSWPGLGRMGYTALLERDYPVLMAMNLILALFTMAGSLLADIGYAAVDPRIRYQ